MHLNIFNGSPRGEKSNSAVLTRAFAKGFCDAEKFPENRFREFFLADPGDFGKALQSFSREFTFMLAFPIYVDAMPGIVKKFIEALEPHGGSWESVQMIFLIQTGFPEETHTRPMKAYLLKLARRLGAPCPGVIRMGGGEGTRHRATRRRGKKLLQRYEDLGRIYAETGKLDEKILASLTGPRRLPSLPVRLILPLANYFFWDRELKKNGAYSKRFDRPLE
jgi:multimeric flavodoxin WrbA